MSMTPLTSGASGCAAGCAGSAPRLLRPSVAAEPRASSGPAEGMRRRAPRGGPLEPDEAALPWDGAFVVLGRRCRAEIFGPLAASPAMRGPRWRSGGRSAR